MHGNDAQSVAESPQPQPDHRFRFLRTAPPSAAAGSPNPTTVTVPRANMVKTFQSEFEASTEGILAKVQDALHTDDPFILTDAQGNEIVDSEGTEGSVYWKQNSRKVYAVPEQVFSEYQQGIKRKSQKEDATGLQEIHDKIEEVLLAAQGLSEVTAAMKVLSSLVSITNSTVLILSNTGVAQIREAFGCMVCKGPIEDPMIATCCNSFVGCKTCVEQWMATSTQCLKCRTDDFSSHAHRVSGLNGALSALADIIKVE
ncbi:uncharacterized protein [Paramormyrops kingsleyae]|uniref:uncharacterized protein isoform X2 n=1 Tax=Paramormyrops kingsleyae TaxID=1676925 RepID=UPI003B977B43